MFDNSIELEMLTSILNKNDILLLLYDTIGC